MIGRERLQTEDDYDCVWRIMADAFERFTAEGVARPMILPAICDLVTAIALDEAGEAGVRRLTRGMQRRIEDWKAGRFPSDVHAANDR